ncbi:MAG: TonB-dependent receptor [Nitrospirae bacterium]|nr:MAG: TonB-dependent receptor [Nitrospirota bacterium]
MRKFIIGSGILLALLWGSGVGHAEEGTPVVQTEEVVTSATKTPVPVGQLTSAVEIITGEEMQRQKFKTVADALRLAQGLAVFSNGGPGTDTSVRIRGGGAAQTLVLIDGAIVNSATTGAYNFANLTTDNIERVEILRGAQSMLWGSDAMGGVINIVTKRGAGATAASSFFEYGSFNSIREGAQVTGKKGLVDFSMDLSRWDFAGFSAADSRLGASERDSFRNWTASSRLGVDLPKDGRLEFNFRWMNGSTSIDNISNPPADVFNSKNKSQQFVFGGSYDQAITHWWNQKLTLARAEEDAPFFPGNLQRNLVTGALTVPSGSPNTTRTLSNRLEWQHNMQVADPLLLTFGYQFREQQGENDTLAKRIVSSNAGFAQAQLNLWDRVFGTAGIRQDSYNVFGTATTYRLTGGYLHKETDTKLRTSYGTGFRAPSVNELYFANFGNPNLKAEKSQSFDVGVDQELFGKRLKLSGGYFWNRYRDQIVTTFDPVVCAPFSTFSFCPLNVGNSSTKGFEASFAYKQTLGLPFIKAFDFQGQYTNTMTRDLSNGARLPRQPVDQWSLQAGYQPIDPLHIILTGRFVGSRFNTTADRQGMQAFDVWNLTTNYTVTKHIEAYVRADNLFNQRYQEILNAGTPVRSIYFGVRINHDLFS